LLITLGVNPNAAAVVPPVVPPAETLDTSIPGFKLSPEMLQALMARRGM